LLKYFGLQQLVVIGLITLYADLESEKFSKIFLIATSIWMLLTLGQNRWTGTNYFCQAKK